MRIRSLFDTDITITDGSSFLTLVSAPDADGVSLCVTGRIIGENEDAQLATAPIQPRDNPLLPAVRYAASGETMPAVSDLLQQQLDWYANVSVALPAFASEGRDQRRCHRSAARHRCRRRPAGVEPECGGAAIRDQSADG